MIAELKPSLVEAFRALTRESAKTVSAPAVIDKTPTMQRGVASNASTVEAPPKARKREPIPGLANPTPDELRTHTALTLACGSPATSDARVKALGIAALVAAEHMRAQFSSGDPRHVAAWYVLSEMSCEGRGFRFINADDALSGKSLLSTQLETGLERIASGAALFTRRAPSTNTGYERLSAQSPAGFLKAARMLRAGPGDANAATNAIVDGTKLAVSIVAKRIGASPQEIQDALVQAWQVENPSPTPRFFLSHRLVEKHGVDGVRGRFERYCQERFAHMRPQVIERLATQSARDVPPSAWRCYLEVAGAPASLDCAPVEAAASALKDALAVRSQQDIKEELVVKLERMLDVVTYGTEDARNAMLKSLDAEVSAINVRGPFSKEQVARLEPIHKAMEQAVLRRYSWVDSVTVVPPPYAHEELDDWLKYVATDTKLTNTAAIGMVDGKPYVVLSGDRPSKVRARHTLPEWDTISALCSRFVQIDRLVKNGEAAAEFAAASATAEVRDRESLATMPAALALSALADAPNILAYGDALAWRGVTAGEVDAIWTALQPSAQYPVKAGTEPAWALVLERLARLQAPAAP